MSWATGGHRQRLGAPGGHLEESMVDVEVEVEEHADEVVRVREKVKKAD